MKVETDKAQRIRITGLVAIFVVLSFMMNGCLGSKALRLKNRADTLKISASDESQRDDALSLYERARRLFEQQGDFLSVSQIDEAVADLQWKKDPSAAEKALLNAATIHEKLDDSQEVARLLTRWYELKGPAEKLSPKDLEIIHHLATVCEKIHDVPGQVRWLSVLYKRSGDSELLEQLHRLAETSPEPSLRVEIDLLEARHLVASGELIDALRIFQKAERLSESLSDNHGVFVDIKMEALPIQGCLLPDTLEQELRDLTERFAGVVSPERCGRLLDSLKRLAACDWVKLPWSSLQTEWINSIIPLLDEDSKIDILVRFAELGQELGENSTASIEAATALISAQSSSSDRLRVAERAAAVNRFDIVDKLRADQASPDSLFQQSDTLAFAVLGIQSLLEKGHLTEARDEMERILGPASPGLDPAHHLEAVVDVAEFCLHKGIGSLTLEVINYGRRDLPLVQSNLRVHSRYLTMVVKFFESQKEYMQALTFAHNHYALYSRLPGYELKKATLYERIADISMASGHIDQKFNPYELALTFLKDSGVPAVKPELYLKLADSRLLDPSPSQQDIVDACWTWFDTEAQLTMATRFPEEEQLLRMYSMIDKLKSPTMTASFYDQIVRRQAIHNLLMASSILEIPASDPVNAATMSGDNTMLALLYRSRACLLLSLRQELMKAKQSQQNVQVLIAAQNALLDRIASYRHGDPIRALTLKQAAMPDGQPLKKLQKQLPPGYAVLRLGVIGNVAIAMNISDSSVFTDNKVGGTLSHERESSQSVPSGLESALKQCVESVLSQKSSASRFLLVLDCTVSGDPLRFVPQKFRAKFTSKPFNDMDAAVLSLRSDTSRGAAKPDLRNPRSGEREE